MNKYLRTLLFYAVSFLLIFLLNMLSPNAQDGGLGFGSLAILLFTLTVMVLLVLNIYKGFKKEKGYYIIAAIHFIILIIGVARLFL